MSIQPSERRNYNSMVGNDLDLDNSGNKEWASVFCWVFGAARVFCRLEPPAI